MSDALPPGPAGACPIDQATLVGPEYVRAHIDGTTADAAAWTPTVAANAATLAGAYSRGWSAYLDELRAWSTAAKGAAWPGVGAYQDSQRYRCRTAEWRAAAARQWQRGGGDANPANRTDVPSAAPPPDAPAETPAALASVERIALVLGAVYIVSRVL